MRPVPIHQLARKMGLSPQRLLVKLQAGGLSVRTVNDHLDPDHLSALSRARKRLPPRVRVTVLVLALAALLLLLWIATR